MTPQTNIASARLMTFPRLHCGFPVGSIAFACA
jgi:hypothetical protein